MKRSFLGVALMVLCLLMIVSAASAANLCPVGGAIDVATLSAASGNVCGIGGLVFSNFSYVLAGGTGPALVDLVGTTYSGSQVLLNFNPNEGTGVLDVRLQFMVTGTVTGGSLTLAPADFGAAITEEFCSQDPSNGDPSLGGTTCGTVYQTLTVQTPSTLTATGSISPAGSFWVWKDIMVSASGHDSSFTEGFTVPEPMTLSLMGIGLLGFGVVGRRLRKR